MIVHLLSMCGQDCTVGSHSPDSTSASRPSPCRYPCQAQSLVNKTCVVQQYPNILVPQQQLDTTELPEARASLIVPDFTISLYGSSCNHVSFFLLCSRLLFIAIPKAECWKPRCRQREKRREYKSQKKRELHELPYTKIDISGTIRITSDPTIQCGFTVAQHHRVRSMDG